MKWYKHYVRVVLSYTIKKIENLEDKISTLILQWSTHNMPYIINNNIISCAYYGGICCYATSILTHLSFFSKRYAIGLYIIGIPLFYIVSLMCRHNNIIITLKLIDDMHDYLDDINNKFCHKDTNV